MWWKEKCFFYKYSMIRYDNMIYRYRFSNNLLVEKLGAMIILLYRVIIDPMPLPYLATFLVGLL